MPCRAGLRALPAPPELPSRDKSCGKLQPRAGRAQTPNVLKSGRSSLRIPAGWIPAGWISEGWIPAGWIPAGWISAGWISAGWIPAGWIPVPHPSTVPFRTAASGTSPAQLPLSPHPKAAARCGLCGNAGAGRGARSCPRGFAILFCFFSLGSPSPEIAAGEAGTEQRQRSGKARPELTMATQPRRRHLGCGGEMPAPFMPQKAATSGLCCWMSPSPSHRREKSIRKN